MASPRAPPLLRLHLDRCSAQTDCRGRIDPMSPLWGRGGRRYQAPQEPGCGRSGPIEKKRFWVDLQYIGGKKTDSLNTLDISQVSIWERALAEKGSLKMEKNKETRKRKCVKMDYAVLAETRGSRATTCCPSRKVTSAIHSCSVWVILSPSSYEVSAKLHIARLFLHCNIHAIPVSLAASLKSPPVLVVHLLLVILKSLSNCSIQALSHLNCSWLVMNSAQFFLPLIENTFYWIIGIQAIQLLCFAVLCRVYETLCGRLTFGWKQWATDTKK